MIAAQTNNGPPQKKDLVTAFPSTQVMCKVAITTHWCQNNWSAQNPGESPVNFSLCVSAEDQFDQQIWIFSSWTSLCLTISEGVPSIAHCTGQNVLCSGVHVCCLVSGLQILVTCHASGGTQVQQSKTVVMPCSSCIVLSEQQSCNAINDVEGQSWRVKIDHCHLGLRSFEHLRIFWPSEKSTHDNGKHFLCKARTMKTFMLAFAGAPLSWISRVRVSWLGQLPARAICAWVTKQCFPVSSL